MKRKIVLVVAIITVLASSLIGVQAAKKVKLNKSKATIKVGQTVSLKVKKTKKKVKWKSSNKNVATVSKRGKVKGKKVGKATIIAKVGKKNLKCKITVICNAVAQPQPQHLPKTQQPTTRPQETSTEEEVNPADWDYEFLASGTVMITGYKGTKTEVTFPSEIEGQLVTVIKGNLKSDSYGINVTNLSYGSLKKVIIPNSIVDIKEYSFKFCNNLEEIVLSNRIIELPRGIFEKCSELKKVDMPSKLKCIGDYAFEDCSNLINISIPSSVTSIGSSAFSNCKKLTSIKLPSGLKGLWATDFIEMGHGGVYMFSGCENLTSVEIPSGITTIPNNMFEGCKNLSYVSIPDTVTEIGAGAFKDCTSLKTIVIPSSVICIYAQNRDNANPSYYQNAFWSGTLIKGKANSYVQTYANEWGLRFQAIN